MTDSFFAVPKQEIERMIALSKSLPPQAWPETGLHKEYEEYGADYDGGPYPSHLRNVSLDRAIIAWSMSNKEHGTMVLVLDSHKTHHGWPDGWSSDGACTTRWRNANPEERLNMMFKLFQNLIFSYGYPPMLVHRALMVIPEYRDATRPYNPDVHITPEQRQFT